MAQLRGAAYLEEPDAGKALVRFGMMSLPE